MRPASANCIRALLVLAAVAAIPSRSLAQALPAATSGLGPSRVDLYGGYGYFRPFTSDIHEVPYETITAGGVFSGAVYFSRHFGIQAEGNYFPQASNDNSCVYTAQAGPILRAQRGRWVPFFHALGGAAEVGGPAGQTCSTWGWGVTGGGGLDYVLPIFGDHLALRPIQADFTYSRINNPNPPVFTVGLGGVGEIYAVRLSAGLNLRLGSMMGGAGTPAFTCSADPADPYPGDPVTVSVNAVNLRSMKNLYYNWESSGGKITGTETGAAVDTHDLAPGSYLISGNLVRGSQKRQVASCTASFTVRRHEPPTVTCSVDRAAINSGDPVTVTAVGTSPQDRPLTYSYTTTNGVISGNGGTATLQTTGATPGTITITCNVMDDKGQSAASRASVVIATPAPPSPQALAQAQPRSLCSISFERDRLRPDRVDNEAKACLDDVALTLNREVGSKLLIIGTHSANESNRNAAERAMNAAQYLTAEKGIDPARLDLRISPAPGKMVLTTLVPAGAIPDAAAGESFDTSTVRRSGQPYGKQRAAPQRPVHRRVAVRPVMEKKRRKAKISEF